MVKFELMKPVMFEGEEVSVLELNVEDLSYKDLRRAEREAQAMCGKKEMLGMVKVFDDRYLGCVAAIAAKVKPDLIFAFKAPDFIALTTHMRNFLLNGEWDTDEETQTTE